MYIYLICCGVMLLLLIIYIYIHSIVIFSYLYVVIIIYIYINIYIYCASMAFVYSLITTECILGDMTNIYFVCIVCLYE